MPSALSLYTNTSLGKSQPLLVKQVDLGTIHIDVPYQLRLF